MITIKDFKIGTVWKKTFFRRSLNHYVIFQILSNPTYKYPYYIVHSKILFHHKYFCRDFKNFSFIIINIKDNEYKFKKLRKGDAFLEML